MNKVLLGLAFGAGSVLVAALALQPRHQTGELALVQALPEQPSARVRYPENDEPVLNLPGGETRTVHSMLNVPKTMAFGDYVWDDAGVPAGPVWVGVDLGRQLLTVFRGGHEIGTAVILYGTDGHPTPRGAFHVKDRQRDYHSRTYDAPMPFMLRLTDDGVAIHGSDVREGRATHGCIGVPPEFAALLFDQVAKGDLVVIG